MGRCCENSMQKPRKFESEAGEIRGFSGRIEITVFPVTDALIDEFFTNMWGSIVRYVEKNLML